jgi:hypothetical protein
VEQNRRHASGLKDDPTTTRRFRQLVGDRLPVDAIRNDAAFAVENTNVGLLHRDVEASKILH